ncbi:transposase [Sphingobium boeckii]|uniref:Transposase n=1 Tax=Sphingobium boeckii TaxID=1082345 RepID=A0A7W9AG29_9SPHN|nr:transposase [Sphingobium boeckii]
MGRFVEGEDWRQDSLLPVSLDDYVLEDNPVRVVEAYIDALDLKTLGFAGMQPAVTGRPALSPVYHVEDLLVRLPQPDSVEPPPRTRIWPQYRTDVVD